MGELPTLRYCGLKNLVLREFYEEQDQSNPVSPEPGSDETDYEDEVHK